MSGDLFEVAVERARLAGHYDPWADLAQRPGVDIVWHADGRSGSRKYPNALGLTTFSELRVSLKVGMAEHTLRGTLAHELVHLDRGPVAPDVDASGKAYARVIAREEARVDLQAAQRLVDPVVFDALIARCDGGVPKRSQWLVLFNCDDRFYEVYADWRRRVKATTAMRAWERAQEPAPWPPRWVAEDLDDYAHTAQVIAAHSG